MICKRKEKAFVIYKDEDNKISFMGKVSEIAFITQMDDKISITFKNKQSISYVPNGDLKDAMNYWAKLLGVKL